MDGSSLAAITQQKDIKTRFAVWVKYHCWIGPFTLGWFQMRRIAWMPSFLWHWADRYVDRWHEQRCA